MALGLGGRGAIAPHHLSYSRAPRRRAQDIVPFLTLLAMIQLGFSLAFSLITKGEEEEDESRSLFSRHGVLSAVSTTIDMGLYGTSIDALVMHEPRILTLYFPFMLIVQVVMLNLLIAIMSSSHARIGTSAALVARYQRAKLIVKLEPPPSSWKVDASAAKAAPTARSARAWLRQLLRHLLQGDPDDHPCPRWLHVLRPSADQSDDADLNDTTERSVVERQIAHVHRTLSRQHRELELKLDALPAVIEKKLLAAGLAAET